ncbi:MAG TPA: Ig-like domain-containing protein [Gemmatimonadales bacterium]|nr:Ig-like domain-containing protein [Gemmatimonadales bacterium]
MREHRLVRMGASALIAAFACGLAACGDGPGEPDPEPGSTTTGVVVTDGIRGADLPGVLSPDSTYLFVAASPNTVPGAASAAVIVGGTRVVSAVVRDGGFDPLPIAAFTDGQVVVQFTDSAGQTHGQEGSVRGPARPRVVRTSPSPGRTDVPLNVRVTTVFSVPMNVATLAAGVQLWRGESRVSGAVQVSPDAIVAEFVPAAPLDPNQAYELRVAGSVEDVRRRQMEQPLSVAFRTGTTIAPVGAAQIRGHVYPWLNQLVDPTTLMAGQGIDVYLSATGDGAPAAGSVRWTSSDPSVLQVEERIPGYVIERGLQPGRAVLRAEWSGGAAEIAVDVLGGAGAELRTATVYVDRYNELWRQRAGGGDAVRLLSVSELPGDSTLCGATGGPNCYWLQHQFAVAPNGRIAVTRLSEIGGAWVKDGPQGPLRRVSALTERGAMHSPAWSPSGDQLAYWVDYPNWGMAELRVVGADGSGQRVLRRAPITSAYTSGIEPTWSSRSVGGSMFVWHPDGRRLLLATSEGTLEVPLGDGSASSYLPGYLPGPWFPGGNAQLVIELASWGRPLRVFRASASGVVDPASGAFMDAVPIAISPSGTMVMDWGFLFSLDHAESFEVTGYQIEHLVGFAP